MGAGSLERVELSEPSGILYEHDFLADTGDFVLEGHGIYEIGGGRLVLDDSVAQSGLTLWLKREFRAPLRIRYEAEVLEPELANNANLFFMARTLQDEAVWTERRSGAYPEYHDRCRMYILTMTGDMAGHQALTGWTRLRKNPGFELLSEDETVKTEVGKRYRIEIRTDGQRIECRMDDRVIHHVPDPASYAAGAIGFRTWKTRLCIRHFRVERM